MTSNPMDIIEKCREDGLEVFYAFEDNGFQITGVTIAFRGDREKIQKYLFAIHGCFTGSKRVFNIPHGNSWWKGEGVYRRLQVTESLITVEFFVQHFSEGSELLGERVQ